MNDFAPQMKLVNAIELVKINTLQIH